MPFCPNCKTEYTAGKRWCTDCAVELVEELSTEDAAGNLDSTIRAAEIVQVSNQTEMELVEKQLRAAGIPTARQPRNIAIYVPEEQLEHARRVLTGEGGQPLFDTVGLSEMHRIRLLCSSCDQPTSVDLLTESVPAKCACGHVFDLSNARPIIDRYTEIVRTMADKDFEIEIELPAEGEEEE